MDEDELKEMAARLRLPLEDLERWHRVHGPKFISSTPGRPKGKVKRPKGALSIGDVIQKYGVDARTLSDWRDQGMPFRMIGSMIVFKEHDIEDWVRKFRNKEK